MKMKSIADRLLHDAGMGARYRKHVEIMSPGEYDAIRSVVDVVILTPQFATLRQCGDYVAFMKDRKLGGYRTGQSITIRNQKLHKQAHFVAHPGYRGVCFVVDDMVAWHGVEHPLGQPDIDAIIARMAWLAEPVDRNAPGYVVLDKGRALAEGREI